MRISDCSSDVCSSDLIAVEPKHPKDLPKLVEALRRLTVEDPNLIVKINEETGETLMAGMGVIHLEIANSLLEEADRKRVVEGKSVEVSGEHGGQRIIKKNNKR